MKTSGGVTAGTYVIAVTARGPNGTPAHVRWDTLNISPIGIQPISSQVPSQFWLYQNYPNPFNPSTLIRYDVPADIRVVLSVYDILGRKVAALVDGRMAPGSYTTRWDASSMPSGIYYCVLRAGGFTQTRTMALVR